MAYTQRTFSRAALFFLLFGIATSTLEAEQSLRESLLKGYNKAILPAPNHTVAFESARLLNLDLHEDRHAVSIYAWLSFLWKDPRLKWSMEDNRNVGKLALSPEDIWTPDLNIYDSVDGAHLPLRSHLPLLVYPTGEISCQMAVDLKFTCLTDLTYWPHDTHDCKMTIGSWVHDGRQLNLTLTFEETELDIKHRVMSSGQNLSATEWRLERLAFRRKEVTFGFEPFVTIEGSLRITRNAPAFGWTVKMPVACLSLLTLVVFLLPPSAGEKLTFAGLCLLLDTVFIGYCTYVVGHSPTHIPLILLLVCQQYVILVVSTVVVSLVLRMAKGPYTQPIPGVLRGPVVTISYFLCLRSYRNLVSKSYDTIALYQKQDQLEIGEEGAHEGDGRQSSDAHEWLLLAAVLDRLALFFFSVISFISLLRFSCVL